MDFGFLAKTLLFRGMTPQEIEGMLGCLGYTQKQFKKGEFIYRVGDQVSSVGMVLSGSVLIENDDPWGNHNLLSKIEPGQVFAETYACVPEETLLVNVVAQELTDVLFLDVKSVLQICSGACVCHRKLISNLLSISSQKNLSLSRRMFYTSAKSIRGRLLSYLSDQMIRQGSTSLTIPLNRQQLADYLNVDRSALSNELGKMKREGLLQVEKNHFLLYDVSDMY